MVVRDLLWLVLSLVSVVILSSGSTPDARTSIPSFQRVRLYVFDLLEFLLDVVSCHRHRVV